MLFLISFVVIPVLLLIVYLHISGARRLWSRARIDASTAAPVLITGCDSGFGRLASLDLYAKGCHVLCACLTAKGCESLESEARAKASVGGKCGKITAFLLDVTKPQDVERMVNDVLEVHCGEGTGLLAVVNNAGVGPGTWVELTSMETFEFIFNVNYLGVVRVTKACLPFLKRRGPGSRVVNISSTSEFLPFAGMSPYANSKAAVGSFTRCLRGELIPWGLLAVVVNPGGHKTALIDGQREYAMKIFHKAPKKIQDEFGVEIFGGFERMRGTMENLGEPSDVSDAMVEAVLAKCPPRRIMVGLDAHFMARPLSMMPDFAAEFVSCVTLASFYNKPKAAPFPLAFERFRPPTSKTK